ncbi:hypothetical protein [Candidatus Uabimicrobium sp. HlEnr_7]|uniref:hypothetical protein n=1 Tax=Candidatus Uabimicrobium helgolandensis TaxID=3095367 RepID=UPI0035588644
MSREQIEQNKKTSFLKQETSKIYELLIENYKGEQYREIDNYDIATFIEKKIDFAQIHLATVDKVKYGRSLQHVQFIHDLCVCLNTFKQYGKDHSVTHLKLSELFDFLNVYFYRFQELKLTSVGHQILFNNRKVQETPQGNFLISKMSDKGIGIIRIYRGFTFEELVLLIEILLYKSHEESQIPLERLTKLKNTKIEQIEYLFEENLGIFVDSGTFSSTEEVEDHENIGEGIVIEPDDVPDDITRERDAHKEPEKIEQKIPKQQQNFVLSDKDLPQKQQKLSFEKSSSRQKYPQQLPKFEEMLSDDAGRPGPVERLIAQSENAMRCIQYFVGLQFIIIANFIDVIVDTIASYINSIYQNWRWMRSIRKAMKNRTREAKIRMLIHDLNIGRIYLSRFFGLAGHSMQIYKGQNLGKYANYVTATFPLKIVLEMREHFDGMKRGLSLLTVKETKQTITKSLWDFFKSFLPDIWGMFVSFKDIFVIQFSMKYNRHQVEGMYVDFVQSYLSLIELLAKDSAQKHIANIDLPELGIYEEVLFERFDHKQVNTIAHAVKNCRFSLQRLLQIMCKPRPFLYPKYWQRLDVIREIHKARRFEMNSFCELELEKWVMVEVRRILNSRGYTICEEEQILREQELSAFQRNYAYQKLLKDQFVL